jgi:hypothetical protein
MKEQIMNKSEAVFHRFIRHVSFGEFGKDMSPSPHNMGGVTLAVKLDYDKRLISIGGSVCSTNENFYKYIGRTIANHRLQTEPFVYDLGYFYHPKASENSIPTTQRFVSLLQDEENGLSGGNNDVAKLILNYVNNNFCVGLDC